MLQQVVIMILPATKSSKSGCDAYSTSKRTWRIILASSMTKSEAVVEDQELTGTNLRVGSSTNTRIRNLRRPSF